MRWLDLRVPPILVGLFFAGAMFAVSRVTPEITGQLPFRRTLALTLAVLGAGIALAGVAVFRGKRTTVNPLTPEASSTFVSIGIYRVSRNPMYLGFLLALGGWAVFLSHPGALVLLPAFVAYLTRYQIQPEERALLAKFGPEFAQYMTRVRRWV